MPAHQPVKQPEGAESAAPLTHAEVQDEKDTTPRVGGEKLTGKRVRAIPYMNATTVRVRPVDFKAGGIDHGQVEWDFRRHDFTVPVGKGDNEISPEAAEYLTKNFSTEFEYMNDGSENGS